MNQGGQVEGFDLSSRIEGERCIKERCKGTRVGYKGKGRKVTGEGQGKEGT